MKLKELIINFTPTGMIPTKEMTEHVPVSVDEIVEDVHEACELGISMVHLHARDPQDGRPTWLPEIYAEMIGKIRKFAPDLVICASLSGRIFHDLDKRAAVLDLVGPLKPDMGSLTLSSLNFNKQASLNSPDVITGLASRMKERQIKPELEAFDAGMINYAKYLIKKELILPPHYFNLILGNIACAQADLLHAGIMIRDLPPESYWSLGGIGDQQIVMNSVAISIGGGVRVGLEDNYWFDTKRTRLARNIDLLERIHVIAQANERDIMKPADLRQRLGLKSGYGEYGTI
ncbi:MAG: 3-keto-5-aminohexanoate cleavage protein [Synergistales bacterium]|nr:3-keto-5-aminohexanoate cleavage protein [Synergistales bacterium]